MSFVDSKVRSERARLIKGKLTNTPRTFADEHEWRGIRRPDAVIVTHAVGHHKEPPGIPDPLEVLNEWCHQLSIE